MPAAYRASLRDWQRAGGEPCCSGIIRSDPEDFQVTELLDVDFDDHGEHDWLWIEKRGANTGWLAARLAQFAGVPSRDVGFAGQKDRHAVCRQWFSVRRPADGACDWEKFDVPDTRVLAVRRHRRKLRRGTHRGNRFAIVVREFRGDPAETMKRIAADGVPNYFGEQRFGREGNNIGLAQALFAGRRLRRDRRSLAISAARSLIFNEVLDRRVRAETWHALLPGDYAMLAGSRSFFAVESVDTDLLARCAAFDLHPTGPLWGRGGDRVRPLPLEQEVAELHHELAEGLERHALASRRALRAIVTGLAWTHQSDALLLEFELESGTFATAVLREIATYDDAAVAGPSAVAQ